MGFLDRLRAGPVLGDGGYLLELEHRGYLQAGPYTPEVVVEHPAAVVALHEEFKRAGAEVLQALTFYGDELKLQVSGHQAQVEQINREAVRLARSVAGRDAFVAGGITQTTAFERGGARNAEVRRAMGRQVELQCAEGVDLLIGETFIHLEEALIAAEVLKSSGLPVVLTLNISTTGSKDGYLPAECARRLVDAGVDVVGINCSFGPQEALASALEMKKAVSVPVACQPIAYRTPGPAVPFTQLEEFPLALEPLLLTRFEMADFARRARDEGVAFIGGCCGVQPYHLRAMAEALGRRPPASAKSPDLSRHVIPAVRARTPA